MKAAAENLTPVTLELGGKSPVIVGADADIHSAALDIAYGKFLNAGQTCIAPDYALVPRESRDRFIEAMRAAVEKYWPDPARNPEYTSVINQRHHDRLSGYLDEARAAGAQVIPIGPEEQAGSRRMPPTLVVDPSDDLRLMRDEIFGPVLPVVTYSNLDEAIAYINDHPRPLALYLFSRSDATIDAVLKRTVSGGVAVNDTLGLHRGRGPAVRRRRPERVGSLPRPGRLRHLQQIEAGVPAALAGVGPDDAPPYGRMHRLLKRILIG